MKKKGLQFLVSLSILIVLLAGTGLYSLLTYRVVRDSVSQQILDDGRMLAMTIRDVVAATYRFNSLSDADISQLESLCNAVAVPNSGFVCIVDPSGSVVAAGGGVREGRIEEALLRQSMGVGPRRLSEIPRQEEASGVLSYPGTRRRELVASVPVDASGYRVQVHQDYAAVQSRATEATRSILPLGLAIAAVVSLIAFFVVDRIVERYEHRLSRANKQLTASNNHRRHLIHVLSHDLKNAIGAILSAQEIVSAYPEERDLYQRIISEGARNSLRIVDLVRMTEAIETGKLELQLQPVQLQEAVLRAVEVVQNKIRRKDIEMEVDIDRKLHCLAEETSFVNSVLVNVLSNAIKFSPRGGKVLVGVVSDDSEITLTVTDHGVGIPPDLLDKLFEPSEPTTRPGTEGENGTGFGLPLTGKFVAAYGGSVDVESEPQSNGGGGWTKVSIRLKSVGSLTTTKT